MSTPYEGIITDDMVERACEALERHGSWRVNIANLNGDDPNGGIRAALEAALNA